jgi:hypothetical protein
MKDMGDGALGIQRSQSVAKEYTERKDIAITRHQHTVEINVVEVLIK